MLSTLTYVAGFSASKDYATLFVAFKHEHAKHYDSAAAEAQTTEKEPGDIGGRAWIRYDDPGEKAFKLNAERNNGRAAMLGITGCLLHEIVGVDALYPTGGFGGDAPREIIDQATAFSGFPSFS